MRCNQISLFLLQVWLRNFEFAGARKFLYPRKTKQEAITIIKFRSDESMNKLFGTLLVTIFANLTNTDFDLEGC